MAIKFKDLSIALKLILVQGVILVAVIVTAASVTSSVVRARLNADSLTALKKTNQQVVQMLEAYDDALHESVDRLGAAFEGRYAGAVERVEQDGRALLRIGGVVVNDQHETADDFKRRTGASSAVLVRQGDDFVRIATSTKKDDGTRAVGAGLGAGHPALALLREGKPFTGKVTLFGRDYMTHYRPLRDTGGAVVGAVGIGLDFTDGLKALKAKVLSLKVGDTGYVYALDGVGEKGRLVLHPAKEGDNILESKDKKGRAFIREIVDKQNGVISYDWQNPSDPAPREKVVAYQAYPAWGWIVATGSYLDEFNRAANDVFWNIILMAAVVVPLAGLSCFVCARVWVARPMRAVVGHAEAIAAGDLTREITVSGRDEVGRMMGAMQKMTAGLRQTLGDVHRASNVIVNESERLAQSADTVADKSQAQSDAASGMAAAVEEMSVSIDQVAQHAEAARQQAQAAGGVAVEGSSVISDAVTAMTAISETVHAASATIEALGDRSGEISKVVQVIREIAEQTNLLALNAAIEAARAGEQGRGFAVVADEVRKLAERTTGSTQEIAAMVASIQHGAEAATVSMARGVTQVEQGVALAGRAGDSIGEIRGGAGAVTDSVANISSAIAEQSAAGQSIASGVEQIAQMAEGNHAVARDTATAARELRELSTELDRAIRRFKFA